MRLVYLAILCYRTSELNKYPILIRHIVVNNIVNVQKRIFSGNNMIFLDYFICIRLFFSIIVTHFHPLQYTAFLDFWATYLYYMLNMWSASTNSQNTHRHHLNRWHILHSRCSCCIPPKGSKASNSLIFAVLEDDGASFNPVFWTNSACSIKCNEHLSACILRQTHAR